MRLKMILVSSSYGTYLVFLGASWQCWAQQLSDKPLCPLGARMFAAPRKQAL